MSVKRFVLEAAAISGLFALGRRVTPETLRILAYHGVQDGVDPAVNFDGFQVPADIFRKQLEHLAGYYHVISPQEALRSLRGEADWPDRAVLITFDDGYQNNATVAAPILREFGMSAILFVTTGYLDGTHYPWWYSLRECVRTAGAASVGLPGQPSAMASPEQCIAAWEEYLKSLSVDKRDEELRRLQERTGSADRVIRMMTWDEARSLEAVSMVVAPHTATHPNLGVEAPTRAREDIRVSIERIGERLGHAPRWYSYPYGRVTDVASEIPSFLQSLGIEAAVTTVSGMNRRGENRYLLKRLNVSAGHQGRAFEKLLAIG